MSLREVRTQSRRRNHEENDEEQTDFVNIIDDCHVVVGVAVSALALSSYLDLFNAQYGNNNGHKAR